MHRTIIVFLLFLSAALAGCAQKTSIPDSTITKNEVEQEAPLQEEAAKPDPSLALESSFDTQPLPEDEAALPEDPTPLTPEEQVALESEPSLIFTLDDQEREEVEAHFKYFTHTARKTFEIWLKRSEAYLPYVKKVLEERGMPEELAYLPFVESGYNPRAYSRAGASGMWQFMPYTGRKFGLQRDWWMDERRDPFQATHAAADYLTLLYGMFDDWYLALAAYNAGEGKIGRALKATDCNDFFTLTERNNTLSRRQRLRSETRNYIPKFLAIVKIMNNLEKLGFEPVSMNNGLDIVPVKVKGGTDLLALTESLGLEWDDFYKNNYSFRTYISPPEREVTVYLPTSLETKAKQFLASAESRPYKGFHVYSVRSGDSWYKISKRYGLPVSVLKKLNKRSSNLIHPGLKIMIPGRESQIVRSASSSGTAKTLACVRGNYTVRKGDSLWEISRRSGVSVKSLMRANGLNSARSLRAGQTLYIPGGETASAKPVATSASGSPQYYTVRKGDTMWSIARKFGIDHKQLLQWNRLSRNTLIHPGDKLKVYLD